MTDIIGTLINKQEIVVLQALDFNLNVITGYDVAEMILYLLQVND